MSEWTQIRRPSGGKNGRRRTPIISRVRKGGSAYILLPLEMTVGTRVAIYHDGGTKVGLRFTDFGDYSVSPGGGRSKIRRICIPPVVSSRVRIGQHEVHPTIEGEYLVFDLTGCLMPVHCDPERLSPKRKKPPSDN